MRLLSKLFAVVILGVFSLSSCYSYNFHRTGPAVAVKPFIRHASELNLVRKSILSVEGIDNGCHAQSKIAAISSHEGVKDEGVLKKVI
jgi:hypothetical protein